jgi:transposase
MNDILLSTLFVGIDVSLEKNHITAMDFHENVFIKRNFINNVPGSDNLVQTIVECNQKFPFSQVIIAIESTSVYSMHIASYLASDAVLKTFNTKVYVLNPKTTSAYRDTFADLQKTDPTDSYMIADFARIGKIKSKPWRGDQHIALRKLTRHRLHIVELLSSEKIYYQSNLFLKFSEFSRLKGHKKLLSNKFGATATSIIEELLTLDDISSSSVETLADFIMEKGKNHFDNPIEIAKKIKEAARNSYKLDKSAYDPITHALSSSLNIIKVYEKEIKVIDKAILENMKGFQTNAFNSLMSVPGLGPVYSAGLIAEIADVHAFTNDDKLAKYAGVTWKKNQSGPNDSDETRLTKTGNKYLRYYLEEATNSVRRVCPEYTEYYNKKYKEVHTHQHGRAISLTSRKLLRLIYKLLVANSQYIPNYPHK